MENIGQIYHKHAIREILNCDMTKALEQDFWEKTLSKLVQRITFNTRLNISNETLSKRKIAKYNILQNIAS